MVIMGRAAAAFKARAAARAAAQAVAAFMARALKEIKGAIISSMAKVVSSSSNPGIRVTQSS